MSLLDLSQTTLKETIRRELLLARTADIAVGQFLLTEFGGFGDELARLTKVRLLIGNNADRLDLSRILESSLRDEKARDILDGERFVERRQIQQRSVRLQEWLRRLLAYQSQSEADGRLVRTLLELAERGKLEVRAALRERLPNDLLITRTARDTTFALYGNSNLLASELSSNKTLWFASTKTEALSQRFEEWWSDATPFSEPWKSQLRDSWAVATTTPYLLYLSVLYRLVADRLTEQEEAEDISWTQGLPPLTDFQLVAVQQALTILGQHRGVFVADVVGLGKTYIGTALLKCLHQRGLRATIFCPPALVPMWQEMSDVYGLSAVVMSTGRLTLQNGKELERPEFQTADRQIVLVDESHRYRNRETASYRILSEYTQTRQCILLTATPYSLRAEDIYSQIRLFADDDIDLGLNPARLNEFFRTINVGKASLVEVLRPLLIRRTRRHIQKHYPDAVIRVVQNGQEELRRLTFPQREKPVVVRYEIEKVYGEEGLYDYIIAKLGAPTEGLAPTEVDRGSSAPQNVPALTYARYGLFQYLRPSFREVSPYRDLKQAGHAVHGFIRILLFKRLESSVESFRRTVDTLLRVHDNFITALRQGYVPAGDAAQRLLYEQEWSSEQDLANALAFAETRYQSMAFDMTALARDIDNDIEVFAELKALLQPITPDKDGKLQRLRSLITGELAHQKVLIFTQYEATAEYLFENLKDIPRITYLSGKHRAANRSFMDTVARFAPKANPRFANAATLPIDVLIATDVLSEGLNLQDCSTIINYDLHYNPVRLIQRVGRVDRIGSEAESIRLFNFFPERNVEKVLHIEEVLQQRIRQIHAFVGEDNAILHPDEKINDQDMYAAYMESPQDESEAAVTIDFTEIEERIRQIQRQDPALFRQIRELPEGVRTARRAASSSARGRFIYLTSDDGFDRISLYDTVGRPQQAGLETVLSALECGPEEPTKALPDRYDHAVSAALADFDTAAAQRRTDKKSGPRLSAAQQYAMRHLTLSIRTESLEDRKEGLMLLEQAIRSPLPEAALRELNRLRRMSLPSPMIIARLEMLYRELDLGRFIRHNEEAVRPLLTRILCSEALL